MLIRGDDIVMTSLPVAQSCFSMFVFIRACFHFTLIGRNLTAQSVGSYRGIGCGI